MKLAVSTFIIPAMVLATLAKGVLLSSTVPRLADDLEERPHHHHPRALDAMGVGSSCAGSEGAWFCMSSSFQRCASGQWSAVMQCAQGTVCQPEGLTYDPVTSSSSLLSSSSSSSSPPTSASTSAFGIVPVMTTSTPTAVVAPTSLTTTMTSSGFTSGETTESTTTASTSTAEQSTTTMTTTSCSAGLSTTSCTTSTETSTAHATESTGAPKNNTSGASRVIGMGLSWSLVGLACAASLTGARAFPL